MFPRPMLASPAFKPFMEAAGIEPAQDSPGDGSPRNRTAARALGTDPAYEDEPNPGALMVLRHSAVRIRELEQRLDMERRERDARALRLVADGHTWRDVADAAGFANPYIAHLKRRARGAGS